MSHRRGDPCPLHCSAASPQFEAAPGASRTLGMEVGTEEKMIGREKFEAGTSTVRAQMEMGDPQA